MEQELDKKQLQPRIESNVEKTMIGMSSEMTLATNNTVSLWQKFMPRQHEIANKLGSNFYAMQVYRSPLFRDFTPSTIFEQWACVSVSSAEVVPESMKIQTIPEGLYAVFIHKGPAIDFPKTYTYISETWLPQSKYTWDFRPHFQVMGAKYKNNDPSSEEEVWVPIKLK